MAKFAARPVITMNITLSLTEEEARALEALAGYGADAFVRVFYEHLGMTYMKPHEQGLRSLLTTSRSELSGILDRLTRTQKEWASPFTPPPEERKKP